jgi:small subunit ribosomal protein S15
MTVTKETREELAKQYGSGPKDSGAPAVQVAIFTARIKDLTQHLIKNPKDYATRRGLIMLVGKRRSMLNYYKAHHTPEQYKTLLDALELRK